MFQKQIDHARKDLIHILEQKVPEMLDLKVIDQAVLKQKWPEELWGIKNTNDLLVVMNQYSKGNAYWDRYLFTLIRIYCIAEKNVRNGCIENITVMANKQLSTKLDIPQEQGQLHLMLPSGTIVKDFLDISPSTTTLYLINSNNPE